jgi:hypothetical protein
MSCCLSYALKCGKVVTDEHGKLYIGLHKTSQIKLQNFKSHTLPRVKYQNIVLQGI